MKVSSVDVNVAQLRSPEVCHQGVEQLRLFLSNNEDFAVREQGDEVFIDQAKRIAIVKITYTIVHKDKACATVEFSTEGTFNESGHLIAATWSNTRFELIQAKSKEDV